MKVRNKKTGEIKNVNHNRVLIHFNDGQTKCINSLAELNEEWEDYEEPKEFFAIIPYKKEGYEVFPYDNFGHIYKLAEELGIAFKTREEAEKAVEKLRAWKRLKDKGFSFGGWEDCNGEINTIYFSIPENKWETDTCDDLDICFGGEE